MRRHVGFAAAVSIVALAGCSQAPQTGAIFGTPSPPVNESGLAGPDTYLAPLPTAFILLKDISGTQNNGFCEAWLPTLKASQTQSEAEKELVAQGFRIRKNTVETDWLVSSAPFIGSDCHALTIAYDFDRAKTYFNSLTQAAAAQKQSLDLSGSGPFVVVVLPGVYATGGTVVIDASKVTDYSSFVSTYQSRIVQLTTQLGSGSSVQTAPPAATPAAGNPVGGGGVAGGSKPWYSGIFGFVTAIISAIWPGTSPIITIIKTVVCG